VRAVKPAMSVNIMAAAFARLQATAFIKDSDKKIKQLIIDPAN